MIDQTPKTLDSSSRIEGNLQTIGYAMCILEGKLHKVTDKPNEDTVFELLKDSSGNLKLGVWQGAEKRVLHNADYVDGCEKAFISNPTSLDIEFGELQKDHDGVYRVTQKPTVKFINEDYKRYEKENAEKRKTAEPVQNTEVSEPEQSSNQEVETQPEEKDAPSVVEDSDTQMTEQEKDETAETERQAKIDALMDKLIESIQETQKLEQQLNEVRNLIKNLEEEEPRAIEIPSNAIYFSSKSKEKLINPASNKDDAKFAVFNINGSNADFAYLGKPINPDFFGDTAEFSKNNNPYMMESGSIKNVKTVSPGKAILENGEWKVISPIKIFFSSKEEK